MSKNLEEGGVALSDFVDPRLGVESIVELADESQQIIEGLRERVFSPDQEKVWKRRFRISEAAAMVGRSPEAVRDAERDGRLPSPETDSKGRRIGYTLTDLNRMREVFGRRPWRDAGTDEPIIMAVQNFKGGVGKSTNTANIAQGFALRGYRVLVADVDPQATTTALFGYNPDDQVDATAYDFLVGEDANLKYARISTFVDQVDLIPSNLGLYNAEYQLAALVRSNPQILDRLRFGLEELADDYDIVLIDPPPALGMISLSALRAANAMIVPVRPATVDFVSTANFLRMLVDALRSLERQGLPGEYKFFRLLVNDLDESKSAHASIAGMMRTVYGENLIGTMIRDSAEIDNAGARLQTVYELEGPITTRKVHDRCVTYLEKLVGELELMIRRTWPSHHATLREEGSI